MKAQERLCDSFSAGNTPEALYNAKMTSLTNEEKALQKQVKEIRKTTTEGLDTFEPTKNLFLQANKTRDEYLLANFDKRYVIANNLLWNLGFKGQEIVNLRLKK